MKLRLTPWLLAAATALACVAGAHASAWGQGPVSSDASAPLVTFDRAAVIDAPAAQLAQRDLYRSGRHVVGKAGLATAAAVVLALGLWVALHAERRAALAGGRRGHISIRGPPAPSHV